MAFRLIFPRSPCAEAAMRTVASSAALRVAEFGTQDHVVFSVGFCPFWCPLNKLT